MTSEELINQLRAILIGLEKVRVAVLFGSYAQGRAKADSDIDLGIAFERALTLDEQLELVQKLSVITKREIDLVDLRKANGVLLQQILNHRKTIVNRDPELMGNLIAKRATDEADFQPLRDMILKKRRERFIGGQTNNKRET